MPRQTSGNLRRTGDGFEIRIWFGASRLIIKLFAAGDSEDAANARREVIAGAARRLKAAGKTGALAAPGALHLLGRVPDGKLPLALDLVDRIVDGRIEVNESTSVAPLFRQVARQWTSGELRDRYPDHVATADHRQNDLRLATIQRVTVGGRPFGDYPVDEISLEVVEAAMARLPETARRPATRRHYGQVVSRVLTLAVYPLRLIAASPIPPRWLPRTGKPPAYPYLYPDEDARLIACPEVPVCWAVTWGVLAREGLRADEARRLAWGDVDIERGLVSLDRTKTRDPRTWALDPGVVEALKLWRAHRGKVIHSTPVLVDENRQPFPMRHLADRLRGHLLAAGVDRRALHHDGENTRRLRAHDLRGTFITLALANGRSETWVADRTGHTSSVMINRYRRQARQAAEVGLGDLTPLVDLIGPRLGQGSDPGDHGSTIYAAPDDY